MIQMIHIILEESDIAIKDAYNEGYKEAYVELQPQIDYWKSLYNAEKEDVKKLKIKNFTIGFITGIVIPGTITLALSLRF